MADRSKGMPRALRSLVKVVEASLGEVVAEAGDGPLYEAVESIRRLMKDFRRGSESGKTRALARAEVVLRRLPFGRKTALARAYTLYLELVNVCENAYRTHRLRAREASAKPPARGRTAHHAPAANVVFVLTAHPTESRSPENIALLLRVQSLLIAALGAGHAPNRKELKHLLHLLWRVGTHPAHRPTVEDEARHIYSLLSDPILDELLSLHREGHRVRLRTWVGGDKDGHPGVGPKQTGTSLEISRKRLLSFIRARLLPELLADARLLPSAKMGRALRRLERSITALSRLRANDGARLQEFRRSLSACADRYRRACGSEHPMIERVRSLSDLFPGLVVPLELREEKGRFMKREPIARMLRLVRDIARGGRMDWYVQGVVVSMTDSHEDILQAVRLQEEVLGDVAVPVIPLFETPEVLARAASILDAAMADPAFRRAVNRRSEIVREPRGPKERPKRFQARRRCLEVMLGYSDSAKRMGSLPSRLAIHDAMLAVGRWARGRSVHIVFFHGSGGSEGRGGGTIAEMAATWPPGTTEPVKLTIQGEMVERTFSTPEILRSQILKVADIQVHPPSRRRAGAFTRELSARAQAAYKTIVDSPEFRRLLSEATPYASLEALTIGSRPPKRGGAPSARFDRLRAIPWVLCWTQTRYLLPVWLGLGTAWRAVRSRPAARERLIRAVANDPLLRGNMRLLGFSTSKTAYRIWRKYAERLAPRGCDALVARLDRERRDAMHLARSAAPGGILLADRLWLKESIRYRAPMIHPLNLLQIEALSRKAAGLREELLFRETVTGVAAGMLTTG